MAHWDDFSNHSTARQLRSNTIKKSLETPGYAMEQNAIVMSRPVFLSSADAAVVLKGASDGYDRSIAAGNQDIFKFKIKITAQANKRTSADDALPDADVLSRSKNVTQSAMRLSLLTTCYSRTGYDGDIPKIGDIVSVKCHYSDFDGTVSLQAAELNQIVLTEIQFAGQYNNKERANVSDKLKAAFSTSPIPGNVRQLIQGDYEINNSPTDQSQITMTWQTALAMKDQFQDVKKYIKAGEGSYESVYGVFSGWTESESNKKVTQMTLNELVTTGMDAIYKQNEASTAAGAYQFIRDTLKEAMQYFMGTTPNINIGNLVYNQQTQEALGTYLLLIKRPILGNYILGTHDNYSEAGQHMAYEWASVPIQYNIISPLKGYDHMVYRGETAYVKRDGGREINRSSADKTPENVITALNGARKEAQNSSAVSALLTNNNRTRTDLASNATGGTAQTNTDSSQPPQSEEDLEDLANSSEAG